MRAVFRRELRACLGGLRGWGYAALVLVVSGIAVAYYNFTAGPPTSCTRCILRSTR